MFEPVLVEVIEKGVAEEGSERDGSFCAMRMK
jgi:hypothetical protein